MFKTYVIGALLTAVGATAMGVLPQLGMPPEPKLVSMVVAGIVAFTGVVTLGVVIYRL